MIAACFLLSRCLVLAIYALRGRSFPFLDAGGYILQAEWLAATGSLSIPDEFGARFFHGMPLLVSLVGRLIGEFAWTGLALNACAGIGAAVLFYRNVGRLDWSLWHACLLPAWVSMTSTLHSEAGMWFFALLALTALRFPSTSFRPRRLLLVVAGYALACRPTAGFTLAPMIALWLLPPSRAWKSFLADALALAVLPVALGLWTWLDAGALFPQGPYQAKEYASWNAFYGDAFPSTVFAWPGQSFLAGFFTAHVSLAINLLNLTHFFLWLGGLILAARAWRSDRRDTFAALITGELALNGLFILTIGGPFGHTLFYRFLATQANAFVLLAWFRYTRLPAPVWWCAAAGSVLLASAAGRGA